MAKSSGSAATGAHASTGPIRAALGRRRFLAGPLGYPTGDMTCGQPSGGCYQNYQGGAIWSPVTGAHPRSDPHAWTTPASLPAPGLPART